MVPIGTPGGTLWYMGAKVKTGQDHEEKGPGSGLDNIRHEIKVVNLYFSHVRLSQPSIPSTKRKFCENFPHYVSSRTYRQHFDLYYDKERGEWHSQESSGEESSELSASENDWNENALEGHLNETPVATESCDEASVSEEGICYSYCKNFWVDFSWVKN